MLRTSKGRSERQGKKPNSLTGNRLVIEKNFKLLFHFCN